MTAVGLVLAVGLTATACSGDDGDGKSEWEPVGAERICDGVFASPVAQRALRTMTGTDRFFHSEVGDGLDVAAEKLTAGYLASGVRSEAEGDLCSVYVEKESGLDHSRVSFTLDDGKFIDSPDYSPKFTPYQVGRRALAGVRAVILYIECVSPEMGSSKEQPAFIRGEFRNRADPAGDARAVREANLTALNAAAFALAGKLGCANNGGLSEQPRLTPAK
ncbi:hypothetical protein [Streptomyces sp. NPDC020965]|uniref:hypothetical protein n=1 Tax=Streptomyces sp. NPDC020965 TaxID=3365105 RepID=UPI0037AA4276